MYPTSCPPPASEVFSLITPFIFVYASASILVVAVEDGTVPPLALLLPPISNQLKFHPFDVEYTLMVCVPAAREIFAVTVCQFWYPPVFGMETVASTVPALFFI